MLKLVGKLAGPKALLIYADVMVGHPPYARPTKMRPISMNMYLLLMPPSVRKMPAASMNVLLTIVAILRPNLSKLLPATIRPAPLNRDTIMPSTAVPPNATEMLAALLITSSPAEFRRIAHTVNNQNLAVFSISPAVYSFEAAGFASAESVFTDAAASCASSALSSADGALMMNAATTQMIAMTIPRILNTGRIPIEPIMLLTTEPRTSPPRPNPISMMPDARPTLSGNHLLRVPITVLYATPTPPPPNTP